MRQIAAVILENERREILLYLRDDKPGLPFPAHWDLFGGHVEAGETPAEALVREVKEELNFDLKEFRFFKAFECLIGDVHPNTKHVFTARVPLEAAEWPLLEGQRMQFFTREEIPSLRLANVLKEIVLDYIHSGHKTG